MELRRMNSGALLVVDDCEIVADVDLRIVLGTGCYDWRSNRTRRRSSLEGLQGCRSYLNQQLTYIEVFEAEPLVTRTETMRPTSSPCTFLASIFV